MLKRKSISLSPPPFCCTKGLYILINNIYTLISSSYNSNGGHNNIYNDIADDLYVSRVLVLFFAKFINF